MRDRAGVAAKLGFAGWLLFGSLVFSAASANGPPASAAMPTRPSIPASPMESTTTSSAADATNEILQPLPESKRGCGDCGRLVGTVSELGSGLPLANELVMVSGPDFMQPAVASATTDALGRFDTGMTVPSGSWYLRSTSAHHINVVYDGVRCLPVCTTAGATPVNVGSGATRVVNLELPLGGRITGTVSMPFPAATLSIQVLHAATGDVVASAFPDGNSGDYDTRGVLAAGSYRIRTSNTDGLVDLAWPDLPCPGGLCNVMVGDTISVGEGDTVADVDFALVAGARVSGNVTLAPEGTAVESVLVWFVSSDGQFSVAGGSDASGDYRTAYAMPAGEWHALIYPSGDRLGENWFEASCNPCNPLQGHTLLIGAGDLAGIDFTLDRPAALRGRITDADTALPLENAEVQAYADNGAAIAPAARSLADGSWMIDGLLPGVYYVVARHPTQGGAVFGGGACQICDPFDGEPIDLAGGDVRADIDLALQPGASIGGQVRGGGVALQTSISLLTTDFEPVASTFSGADGSYGFGGLEPGEYLVLAQRVDDYVATLWPSHPCQTTCGPDDRPSIVLQQNERRDGVDIAAVRGGYVSGTITSEPAGTPLRNVRVTAITRMNYFVTNASTDADGNYRLGPIAPETVEIRTANTGAAIAEIFDDIPCVYACSGLGTPITVAAGDEHRADFSLRIGGRIAGRVTEAGSDTPLPDTFIRILDHAGRVVEYGYADEDGDYLSGGLPTGDYFVRTESTGAHIDAMFDGVACYWCLPLAGTAVGVVAGSTTGDIDFALAVGARIGGRISDAVSGAPLAYYTVLLYDAQGRLVATPSSDESGHWRSGGLAPGTYYLRTFSFGTYRDQRYDGVACNGNCDVRGGTPVQVQASDLDDLDFALIPALFFDGFEYPDGL